MVLFEFNVPWSVECCECCIEKTLCFSVDGIGSVGPLISNKKR